MNISTKLFMEPVTLVSWYDTTDSEGEEDGLSTLNKEVFNVDTVFTSFRGLHYFPINSYIDYEIDELKLDKEANVWKVLSKLIYLEHIPATYYFIEF